MQESNIIISRCEIDIESFLAQEYIQKYIYIY